MPTTTAPRIASAVAVGGVVVVTLYGGFVSWAAGWASYDVWGALVVVPLLLLISAPMLARAGRREADPRFLTLLVLAFGLKALATVGRYLMAFALYDGSADAAGYDANGARLAESYREGIFDAEIGRDFIGTGFIRVLTGVLYAITGPSIFVAYAVFSWLGFWGLYFLFRAFRVAMPDGDARRYALLVLFLPSMLFWPSGLGKEAWMTFGIGLAAYGSALLLSGHRHWVAPLLLGLVATGVVRPHVTAALFAAVAAAYLLGRQQRPPTELTPLARAVGVSLIALGGLISITQAAAFLNVDDVSVSNIDAAIDETAQQTDTGGSAFDADGVNSPMDFPVAAASVLFRPFVFEVDNAQMLLAAAEGILLMVLVALSLPRMRTLAGGLRRQPYLLMCLVYAGLFIYAFSNFSNLGILTRERVQVLPFVLVFLALPRTARSIRPPKRITTTQEGVPV